MKLNISAVLSFTLLACSGIEAKLTESQKNSLLSLHKNARAMLNSKNMKSISWSDSLAEKAQDYSEQCKGMVHSGAGPENLAGSTTGDVSRMFGNWMDEKKDFNRSGFRSHFKGVYYDGEEIGHYSQIVWADNTKVGCGMTYCEDYSAKYLLVCRYETGNIIGEEVYAASSEAEPSTKKETTTTRKTTTTTTRRTTTTTTTTKKTTTTTTTTIATTAVSTAEPNIESTIPNLISNDTLNGNNTLIGNSTLINTNNNTTQIELPGSSINTKNDEKEKEKIVETENVNEKFEEDGIIDQVGPSGYADNTGTYVTGVALTGSVVGAAAVFVFLKKNPSKYEQVTESMKSIQRNLTRKATSVKRGATIVTRKLTTKRTNVSSVPDNTSASDAENPYNINYRAEFAQNFDY